MTDEVLPVTEARQPQVPGWSWPARVGFRWFTCYFALYSLVTAQFGALPRATTGLQSVFDRALPPLGHALFGVTQVPLGFPTGSGDTIADYLRVVLFALLATAATIVWTMRADVPSHRRLAVWVLSALRYTLAVALMEYGADKILMRQMPAPDAAVLTQQFGEMSPMGLLWAFTGASPTYEIFGGLAEFIPGLLLVFRRTSLVGAMLAIPVMVNVVLLNFAYDVPVKLYSTHLLVMAIAVIAPHLRRLYGVLVQNCPVAPGDVAAPVTGTRLRAVRGVWKTYVLALGGMHFVHTGGSAADSNFTTARERSLDGVWQVRNAEGLPFRQEWRQLAIDRWGYGRLRMANDSVVGINARVWYGRGELVFPSAPRSIRVDAPPTPNTLSFALPREAPLNGLWALPGDTIVLHGSVDGEYVHAVLVRRDLSRMELTSRGFHWVQQYPYSR